MGHSVGEYVAACVAGVFGLRRWVAADRRARAADAAAPSRRSDGGGLCRRDACEGGPGATRGSVSIAALNGPENTVISGPRADVEAVVGDLASAGVDAEWLKVSHAFHSDLMDPMLAEFDRVASLVKYAPPRIALVSNVTGKVAGPDTVANAAYWLRHVREPVRFADGVPGDRRSRVPHLRGSGTVPDPVGHGAAAGSGPAVRVPAVRSKEPRRLGADARDAGPTVGAWCARRFRRFRSRIPAPQARAADVPVRAAAALAGSGAAPGARRRRGVGSSRPGAPADGQRLRSPAIRDAVFETGTDRIARLYSASSPFDAPACVPVAAFVEMALQGADEVLGSALTPSIEDLRVDTQLVVPTQGERLIQLVIGATQGAEKSFEIVSSEQGDEPIWTRHVSGRLRANAGDGASRTVVDVAGIEARCTESIDADDLFGGLVAHPDGKTVKRWHRSRSLNRRAVGPARDVRYLRSADARGAAGR